MEIKLHDKYDKRDIFSQKVVDFNKIEEKCSDLRNGGNNNIVLITGCFDLVHGGHLDGIADASEYGTVIVGINSDKSVQRLKGEGRPIRCEKDRAYLMSAFAEVAAVTIFDDDCELIRKVHPQFYITSQTSHEKAWEIPERKNLLMELKTVIIMFGPEKRDSTTSIIGRALHSAANSIIDNRILSE